jgi:hypothetical protein
MERPPERIDRVSASNFDRVQVEMIPLGQDSVTNTDPKEDENSPTVHWPMLGVTKQLDVFERRFRSTRRQSPTTRHVSSGNDPGIGGTLAVFWHV